MNKMNENIGRSRSSYVFLFEVLFKIDGRGCYSHKSQIQ